MRAKTLVVVALAAWGQMACGGAGGGGTATESTGSSTGAAATGADDLGTSSATAGATSEATSTGESTSMPATSADSSSTGTPLDEPVDGLIDAMPANSWLLLPASAMVDACPEPLDHYRCETVMSAWSGASYDHGRDRMLVFGGGHSDSYYNNIFAFDLGPMTWTRLTELPAGADGHTPTPAMMDGRAESCGYYPSVAALTIAPEDMNGDYIDASLCHRADILAQLDTQQPRSSHTYGKPVYLPTQDAFFYLGGGYFPGAQTSSPWGFRFDFATGTWSESAVRPGFMGRGMAAIDAAGDAWYATDDGGPFVRYRAADDAWDTYGSLNYDVRGVGDIDRTRNRFWLLLDNGDPTLVRGFELDDIAHLMSSDPYVDVATTGDAPTPGNRVGFVYADGLDRFAAWNGGADVYLLDPSTQVWTHQTGGGDLPPPPLTNGTYGRWRYSTTRGVFVLANDVDSGVYLYKP